MRSWSGVLYLLNVLEHLKQLMKLGHINDCFSPSCMNEKELEELSKLEHKLIKDEIKNNY